MQKTLAEEINVSQQTISLYESGRREPNYNTIIKIADYFNVSMDYLF